MWIGLNFTKIDDMGKMLRKTLNLIIILIILGWAPLHSQIVQPYYMIGPEGTKISENLLNEGLLKKSEEMLSGSLRLFPENVQKDKAVLLLAEIDMRSGNYKNADLRLEQFINSRSNSPFRAGAALQRAYIAFEGKKFDRSDKLFGTAIAICDSEAVRRGDSLYLKLAHDASYWRGISLAQQGKYQDAQPVFEETFHKYPGGNYADDALYAIGIINELDRKYEVANDYFRTVAKKYPYSNSFIASRIREINNLLVLRDAPSAIGVIENTEIAWNHISHKDSIGKLFDPQSYSSHAGEELTYLRGEANNLAGNFDVASVVFQSFIETYSESELINYARLGMGWALLNKSDYKNAVRQFDDIVTSLGTEDSKIKTLALLYRTVSLKRSGDVEGAQKELSALSVQPSFPFMELVLLELGQIYYEKGDYDKASRTLERADREAADAITSVRIHLLLGASYLEQKIWNKAINEYKIAEQLALKSTRVFMPQKDWYLAEARLKMGIALLKSGRNAEAIPPLQAFIGDNRKDPRAEQGLFWLAEAYYRTDLLNNAAETYQSLLDLYPNTDLKEDALYGLGWSYFRQKSFERSSKTFDKMIKEFPETKYGVEVLTRQGDGYYVTHNYKDAAESYRRAAKLAPKTEEGQYSAYQLAHALYRLGSYEEAITSLLNFVRVYPKSPYAPNALYLNGWIRFQQKKYDESIDDFKFLIQAYPQSTLIVRAHYAIGDAYYNMGKFDEAINSYRTVVESYPSSSLAPEAWKSMHYCYIALGKTEEAMKIADKIIESNPQSPIAEEFTYKKGEMFYQGKNYKDAVSEYENFIKKYPESGKNAEALYWMGKSYVNMNDPENAHKSFSEIRNKYPKSEQAPISLLEEGLLYKEQQNIQKSDEMFGKLQETYPEHEASAQAGYERAAIKYTMGDTVAALNLFREVAAKYAGKEFADQSIYRVAMHYRLKTLYDSSRVEFEKIAGNMDNPALAAEAQYRIGEIYLLQERVQDAIKAFSLVKDKFSGYEDWYSLSLLNLGECYEKVGNFDAALETYQALSTLRPDDDYGNTARRRLKQLAGKN